MTWLIEMNKGRLTEEKKSQTARPDMGKHQEEGAEIKPFSDEAESNTGHRAKKEIRRVKILT